MDFNSYIWQLYKESAQGKTAIETYTDLYRNILDENFTLELGFNTFNQQDKTWEFSKAIIDGFSDIKLNDISEAASLFEEIIEDQSDELLDLLVELSVGLYTKFPEYFFPYFFDSQFYLFGNLCHIFNIPLPEIPKKRDIEKRLHYYFDLCQVLYEFRKNRNFSPEDLCAFLYSFSLNFITKETEDILPKPMNIWIIDGLIILETIQLDVGKET